MPDLGWTQQPLPHTKTCGWENVYGLSVAMPKFSPEHGFGLRTPELNLRFRSGSVPVLLADRVFSSRFQEANNFVNLKPMYIFLGITVAIKL